MFKKLSVLILLVIASIIFNGIVVAVEENPFILDDFIVIASRTEEEILDVPVSAEVITREEIEKLNIANISDALNMVAGLHIKNYGVSGLNTISIRGSKAEQVLIMLDGVPINSSQNGQLDLSLLNINNVERIEIMRGPASSLYGANAVGGVIDIVSRVADDDQKLNLNYSYGSFNTIIKEFNYTDSSDALSFLVSASDKKSDGHRENSWLEQRNYLARFNYNYQKTDIGFIVETNTAERGVPGLETYPSLNAFQDDQQTIINLNLEKHFENSDLQFSLYRFSHLNKYSNPDTFENSEHDMRRDGFNINSSYYSDRHTLITGLDYNSNYIESTDNGRHRFYNRALYIQDKYQLNNNLGITMGLRYDQHEKFSSALNPRIGLSYAINPDWNIYSSYGRAYRAPSFNELYWPYLDYGAFGIYEGNEDLNPELADAFELGTKYSGDIDFEFNIYRKSISDLIDWSIGEDGVNRPYNVNSALNQGTEIKISKKITDNLFLEASSSYLVSKDMDSGVYLDKDINTDFGMKYKGDILSAGLYGQTRRDILEDRDYTVINIALSRVVEIKNTAVDFNISINNLTDREYQVQDGYPMPGRNYLAEFSIDF